MNDLVKDNADDVRLAVNFAIDKYKDINKHTLNLLHHKAGLKRAALLGSKIVAIPDDQVLLFIQQYIAKKLTANAFGLTAEEARTLNDGNTTSKTSLRYQVKDYAVFIIDYIKGIKSIQDKRKLELEKAKNIAEINDFNLQAFKRLSPPIFYSHKPTPDNTASVKDKDEAFKLFMMEKIFFNHQEELYPRTYRMIKDKDYVIDLDKPSDMADFVKLYYYCVPATGSQVSPIWTELLDDSIFPFLKRSVQKQGKTLNMDHPYLAEKSSYLEEKAPSNQQTVRDLLIQCSKDANQQFSLKEHGVKCDVLTTHPMPLKPQRVLSDSLKNLPSKMLKSKGGVARQQWTLANPDNARDGSRFTLYDPVKKAILQEYLFTREMWAITLYTSSFYSYLNNRMKSCLMSAYECGAILMIYRLIVSGFNRIRLHSSVHGTHGGIANSDPTNKNRLDIHSSGANHVAIKTMFEDLKKDYNSMVNQVKYLFRGVKLPNPDDCFGYKKIWGGWEARQFVFNASGMTMFNPSLASFSTEPLNLYYQGAGIIVRLPQGAFMDYLDIKTRSIFANENEILLKPFSKIKIIAVIHDWNASNIPGLNQEDLAAFAEAKKEWSTHGECNILFCEYMDKP